MEFAIIAVVAVVMANADPIVEVIVHSPIGLALMCVVNLIILGLIVGLCWLIWDGIFGASK